MAVAILNGRDEISLLDQMSTPIGVATGFLAIYLTLYELTGRRSTPARHRRPGWTGSVCIMMVCALAGGFLFSKAAIASQDKRDIFEIHRSVWAQPCTATEGPLLQPDRGGGEKFRFLCRFKLRKLAAEVFVTEYASEGNLEVSRPKDDPQVSVLESGEWTGPEKTSGAYLKYILRDPDRGIWYCRYWLADADTPVAVVSSVDLRQQPDSTGFDVPREALLAKRYRLDPSAKALGAPKRAR